jgi:hypothetical protein
VLVEQVHPTRAIYRMTPCGETSGTATPEGPVGVIPIVAPCGFSVEYDVTEPLPFRETGEMSAGGATVFKPLGDLWKRYVGAGLEIGCFRRGEGLDDAGRVARAALAAVSDPAVEATRRRQFEEITQHALIVQTPEAAAAHKAGAWARAATAADVVPGFAAAMMKDFEHLLCWPDVVAVLALMNDRRYVAVSDAGRAPGRRIVGRRATPYLVHHRVSLTAPGEVVVRAVTRALGERVPRRRHEVAGHWRRDWRRPLDEACAHVFADDTEVREVCVMCDGRRSWVGDHMRGDAGVGYVGKDYAVAEG